MSNPKFIYIIGFGDPEFIKIGVSDDPCKRIRNVANGLGIKLNNPGVYISSLQKNPYLIERKCHAALSEYCLGGFGPEKKYKRETFKCEMKKAREVLGEVISLYN